MKKIVLALAITTAMLFAVPTQLPSEPTFKQHVKAGFYGVILGAIIFPGLVAGDIQWTKLNNAGNCDMDHDVIMYLPIPVQYGTDQKWQAKIPCLKWSDGNNTNNIPIKDKK